MTMYNPPHPGEVIHELCIEPLGLFRDRGRQGPGRQPEGPLRAVERQDWDFDRNGDPAFQGVWWKPGKLASATNAVRSMEKPGPRQENQSREIPRGQITG